MDEIEVGFCFYDDDDYAGDADRDSRKLQRWHQRLWSKELPDGRRIQWEIERESSCLTHDSERGSFRVASDTIATSHASYTRFGIPQLWGGLSEEEREQYDRGFYTIGGFIVFPRHTDSMNQIRGRDHRIADRFDLTLECIRLHYEGSQENPLSEVLLADAAFFGLFGDGITGFVNYVEFFHLQDLIADGSIRWLDGYAGEEWQFGTAPLPTSPDGYRRYLTSVAAFVAARNGRIAQWLAVSSS